MKIVNRADFLKMPEGTLFSKYEPCSFSAFAIKGETIIDGRDFYVQEISDAVDAMDSNTFGDILEKAEEFGSSFGMDFNCEARDGCFDYDELYAVWEKADVIQLIKRLEKSLKTGY